MRLFNYVCLEKSKRGNIVVRRNELCLEEKMRMNLTVYFDDGEDSNQDVYEGYFRLFTDEGIPFGDVLFLQVVTED